jgi:hypothetical protein
MSYAPQVEYEDDYGEEDAIPCMTQPYEEKLDMYLNLHKHLFSLREEIQKYNQTNFTDGTDDSFLARMSALVMNKYDTVLFVEGTLRNLKDGTVYTCCDGRTSYVQREDISLTLHPCVQFQFQRSTDKYYVYAFRDLPTHERDIPNDLIKRLTGRSVYGMVYIALGELSMMHETVGDSQSNKKPKLS